MNINIILYKYIIRFKANFYLIIKNFKIEVNRIIISSDLLITNYYN